MNSKKIISRPVQSRQLIRIKPEIYGWQPTMVSYDLIHQQKNLHILDSIADYRKIRFRSISIIKGLPAKFILGEQEE